MNTRPLLVPTLLAALLLALGGCTHQPAPYAQPRAPQTSVAPGTTNGMVTPSYGSGFNPETGLMNEGH
jgi:hypothetical protein